MVEPQSASGPPRPDADRPTPARIVVGVDGSAGSHAALRWALGEARMRQMPVHVVLAWRYHPTGTDPGANTMGALRGPVADTVPGAPAAIASDIGVSAEESVGVHRSAAEASVNRLVESVVTAACSRDGADTPPVTYEAREGHPAKVLLEAVTPADVLVVGSRGHGEFVGVVLGSVSHHVVTHASCPVVVVPKPADE